jgi:uncharacterized protein (DUF1810 family)
MTNWDKIYVHGYRHFDCEYLSAASPKFDARLVEKRNRKQRTVQNWITKTRQLIESQNPPRTKREAVKALSPVMAYLLWSIFKMLVIQIIEWVWDQYEEQQRELATGANSDR